MPTSYDPQILQDYADDLYKQARYIVIRTALKYGLIVFLVSILGCFIMARLAGPEVSDAVPAIVIFLTLVGIAAGVDAGRREAFSLKLQAQELLCQRQIERKPYSVVIINKDGIHVFDEEVIKQFVQSMDTFGAAVNRLLLSCGDTSIRSEVFKQKVEEFSETTQHLRKDYMETVGERTFKRMFESGYCGDPISIIPPGTKLTVDSEYNVDVSEMSSEEREHHFSMKKEAERLAEELRVAQEKMAKLVQGREPLYQGRERVLLRPARPHSVKAGTQAS